MNPMHDGRLENVFGALALAASDAILRSAMGDGARGSSTAAALNLIGHVPGTSVDLLARGLSLSHPGTVRLVDRLVADGFVSRTPSMLDRRSVELRLTSAGTRKRRALVGGRRAALDDFLEPLSAIERRQLDAIASKLLRAHVTEIAEALATCRFCDERACLDCPVDSALEASA